VRIIDTREKAAYLHQAGLVRLFQLSLRKDYQYVLKNIIKKPEIELTYNRLSAHPLLKINTTDSNYRNDVMYTIFSHVFVQDADIRTEIDFTDRVQYKSELVGFANIVGKLIQEIITLYMSINAELKRISQDDVSVIDIRQQLDYLVYQGFIRCTPFEHMQAMPRYLQAIEYRMQKMFHDKHKDLQKTTQMNGYWKRYWDAVAKKIQKENMQVEPEQDKLRWMLEEFRVSLFAQQLKTAYPISAKRLEKAWDS
jgi:ATP-dependent helicase HrpA